MGSVERMRTADCQRSADKSFGVVPMNDIEAGAVRDRFKPVLGVRVHSECQGEQEVRSSCERDEFVERHVPGNGFIPSLRECPAENAIHRGIVRDVDIVSSSGQLFREIAHEIGISSHLVWRKVG